MARSSMINTLSSLWPLGAIAPLFGGAYFLLCYLFPDAIEVSTQFRSYFHGSNWGGVEVLFMMVSVGMGWVCVVIAEQRLHWAGAVLLFVVLPFCLGTIGAGLLAVWLVAGDPSSAMWEMMGISAIAAIVSSVIRIYWGGLE